MNTAPDNSTPALDVPARVPSECSAFARRVVCAALRCANGRIICGARHFDPIMRAQITASEGYGVWRLADQGFIDNFGRFLSREAAHQIAWEQDQIRHRCGGDAKRLFSENLY